MKCSNCGSVMTIKDNCVECSYCGTQYISFYAGSIDSDVASIKLDELLKEIEKNKKDFLIVNGKISSGDINEIIANSGLKIALEELKKENYYSASQYAKKASGIEATRISFLAKYKCKNESYLQEKCIWDNLKSSDIPSDLINSEAYGTFYSSFKDYCEQRERAASDSNALIQDYVFKYLYLDKQIKAISGNDIYEVLRRRANEICKKYPIFPEPWIALKYFDKSAISKMICAFQNSSFNYGVLQNWSNNHFVSRYLNICDGRFVYKVLFSQDEVILLKNELARRYSNVNQKRVVCSLAQKQNCFTTMKLRKDSVVQRIEGCFLVYPQKLYNIAKEVVRNYFTVADEYWEKNGSNGCWTYAGIRHANDSLWQSHAYWFPTKHSKSKNERLTFDNYGLSFSNMLPPGGQEAIIELLYEQMEYSDNNFTYYEIKIEDAKIDLNPSSIFSQKKSIAQLIRITASW